MGLHDAIVWTSQVDALIGSTSDAKVGELLRLPEDRVRYRRRELGLPTYRSSRAAIQVPCANCGKTTPRKQRDRRRSGRLIRKRNKVCQACGKTPEQNGAALHVHHLKPFGYGGTNQPANLVALCDSCHHIIESVTDQVLASIQIDVTLDGFILTVTVEDQPLWRGSAVGAACQTPTG
jgi:hypothetical protein